MGKGGNKSPRNPPSCFSTAPFSLTFLSNLIIAFEVKLLANPGKLSLAKGIAILVSAFFPKLPKNAPNRPLD